MYRFKAGEKREGFDKIVEHSFPQLLNIGVKLVDEESLEAAEMLRIVVKSYKHAIYVGQTKGKTDEAWGLLSGLTVRVLSSIYRRHCKYIRQPLTGVRYS